MDNRASLDPWPQLIPARITSFGGRTVERSFAVRLTRTGILLGVFVIAFVASLAASAFELRLAPDTYDASRAASLDSVQAECDVRVAFDMSPSRGACYSWMAENMDATRWVSTALTPVGMLRAIAIAVLAAGIAWGVTGFATPARPRRTRPATFDEAA